MTKNAKQKLIEASYLFMLTKGYSSTSVDELCESAGVSKGSFYHFFKSKEELGIALLDDFHDKVRNGFLSGDFIKIKDPQKRMLAFFKHTEENAHLFWGNGCLLGSFASDLAETNEQIRKKVSSMLDDIAVSISKIFNKFSELYPENKNLEAKKLAENYIMMIEGAIVLCKAHHDNKFLDRALVSFRENVEAQIK